MYKSRSSDVTISVELPTRIEQLDYAARSTYEVIETHGKSSVRVKSSSRTWDQVYTRAQYIAARTNGTLQSTYASRSYFSQGTPVASVETFAPQSIYDYYGRLVRGTRRGTTVWGLWTTPASAVWSSARDLNALNRAKVQALNKAAEIRSMLLVDFAEAQKTQDMIGDRVKQLATALSQVKKLQFGKAGKTLGMNSRSIKRAIRRAGRRVPRNLDKATSFWLEARYGWLPLIYSIQDAAGHLGYLMEHPKLQNRTLRSHASYTDTRATVSPWQLSTCDGYLFKVTRNRTDETVNTVKFWVKVSPSSYELHQLNAGGFVNLAEVAWELVPLSFVVDWFIPIGDWIASLSSLVGLSVTDAGYSTARLTTTRDSFTGPVVEGLPSGGGFTASGWDSKIEASTYDYNRYSKSQLDGIMGGVYPSFPPVKIKLNSKRFLDAFSLLQQAGSGSLRRH